MIYTVGLKINQVLKLDIVAAFLSPKKGKDAHFFSEANNESLLQLKVLRRRYLNSWQKGSRFICEGD